MTRLTSVVLHVRDLESTASFYRRLGVPVARGRPPQLGVEASWRDDDELRLTLVPAQPGEESLRGHLGFVVDDLTAAHERALDAGAEVVDPPRDEPRGLTAVYRDPEGNLVTLTERPRPLRVAGVDVARGAWAVVVLEDGRVVDAFRCDTFADALLVDARVVAVDIPIGIPDEGPRAADEAARRFVGPRASSVFTTPVRRVLEAPSYTEAREVALQLTGQSISAQSYALARRILEVDDYAQTDERVVEVHPEVSFRELARRPLPPKRQLDGLVERRRLLEEEAGLELPRSVPRIAEPDLLDAAVAAWTAARYARGEALPLPERHEGRIGAIWR